MVNGFSTMTFISKDLATVENLAYFNNNKATLGARVLSLAIGELELFIVDTESNALIVVDRGTLRRIATITTGLHNPRCVVYSNDKI